MKSRRPKHVGFIVPSRFNVSSMFGMDQPSRSIIAALTVGFRVGVSLASLAGLRFLDDAELQPFVDLRADSCLLFSGMESRGRRLRGTSPLRSIDFDNH